MTESRARRIRWWVVAIVAMTVAFTGQSVLTPEPGFSAQGARPDVERAKPVHLGKVQYRSRTVSSAQQDAAARRTRDQARRAVTWPAAKSGIVGGARSRTVSLGPVSFANGSGIERRVRIVDRREASKAGVDGIAVELAPLSSAGEASSAPMSAPARVTVDLSGFAHAYGASWASRLRAFAYPACLLTTPKRSACQVATPLVTKVGASSRTLTATIPAAKMTATSVVAVTAVAASASGNGDFGATPMSQSASWTSGGSSGDFNVTYPIRTVPANSGPAPSINLTYSSQSVDGRTASTNNQSSQLGEGWDVGDSYIERDYVTCKDDGVAGRYDLCWKTDNAHLVLNGQSNELIKSADGTWRLSSDDGSRVRRLTSTAAGNQDNDKEYWELTTSSGTKYYFGRTIVPNQTASTNSVWWVPVNGNNSGEPCNAAGTTYATRFCKQAWRWSLDYVVDPHGNAMSYWYSAESNYYAKNQVASPGTEYIRGGRLSRIDYGLREGSTAPAAFQVAFTGATRCVAATGCTSYSKAGWPDTPYDQICASTATCTGKFAPTFFTRYRLTKITTRIRKSAAYSDVESWAFTQQFLNPGDASDGSLWLKSISHTGLVGGTATYPDVTFGALQLTNRVSTAGDGLSVLPRFRLSTMSSEAGALTTVEYSSAHCVPGNLPAADNNTQRCFPQKWTPEGSASPRTDWFHKYVVAKVTTRDADPSRPSLQTNYSYGGGGAWAYNDNKLIPEAYRTWSQWRGYATVTTIQGDPTVEGERSQTTTRYFRGMDGDKQASGTPRDVTVSASDNTAVQDARPLAGMPRETTTYTKAGGAEYSGIINTPWTYRTAGSGLKSSWFVGTGEETSRAILANGQWRRRAVTRSFSETTGRVTRISDAGDTSVSDDQTCTATDYADTQTTNGAWFVGYPKREVKSRGLCGADALNPGEDKVLADSLTYYDKLGHGTAPTKGLVTRVDRLKAYNGTEPQYQTVVSTDYDAYGRPTATTVPTAANGTRTDTVAYAMTSDGTLASTTQTQDQGGKNFTTTATMAPEWGLSTKVVDPNNKTSELAYDPFGRLISVWHPNRARTATPSIKYAYTLSKTAASTVKTSVLNTDGSGYVDSFLIYDSLLRPTQTQTPTPAGDRIIGGTEYDSRGQRTQTYADVYAAGAPSGTTVSVPDGSVPALTRLTTDGLGRITKSTLVTSNVERWSTTTEYLGSNVTRVTPPDGAAGVTVTTDIRGRKIKSVEHGSPDLTTTYAYDLRDNLTELTSPGGQWTYRYDLRGRQTESTDPDVGTTVNTYTDADQLATTTDARGQTLLTTYDQLDRPTALYDGTAASDSQILSKWTYDTASKGLPYGQIRYFGGLSGDSVESRVTSYNSRYNPVTTKVILTSSPGSTRFQGLPTTLDRDVVYNVDQTVAVNYLPKVAVGSQTVLSSEALSATYTSLGLVDTIQGRTGVIQDVVYDQLRQPQQVVAGRGSAYQLYLTREFDEGTNRPTRELVTSNLSSTVIADPHFTYDDTGNPTKIADTAVGDIQCLRYDDHQRLSAAWTPGDGNCATEPETATLGGPAPYYQSWTFTAAGLRGTQTVTSAEGTTTDTYHYPDPGSAHQNFLTRIERTGTGSPTTLNYDHDAIGNTITRPDPSGGRQILDWDAERNLRQVTRPGGKKTTHLYNVDGELLLTSSPESTVFYAGDTEITYNKTTAVTTAKRTYDTGLGIIGIRHGDGVGDLTLQVTDAAGTATVSLDATTLAPVYRRQTPYGGARGPQPASWPNNRGFLDKPHDPGTELTSIGARDYDSGIGRFLSPDPVLDPASPGQMLGYTYANNNPMTFSDPTGMTHACVLDGTCNYDDTPNGPVITGTKPSPSPPTTVVTSDGQVSNVDKGDFDLANDVRIAFQSGNAEDQRFTLRGIEVDAGAVIETYLREQGVEDNTFEAVLKGLNPIPDFGQCTKSFGGCLWEVGTSLPWFKLVRVGDNLHDAERAADAAGELKTGERATDVDPDPRTCLRSFDGATLVLMADGAMKPIEEIEVGDEVIATDPQTGARLVRTVTRLWVHGDEVADLLFTDGTVLTTTEDHLIWSVTDQVFEQADELAAGEVVLGDRNREVAVVGFKPGTSRVDLAYNLTVAGVHTYHVGANAIVVHNDNESPVGTVFRDGQYRFQILSRDHAPAHGHLTGPGIPGHGIQIGQNGKPINGSINLTAAQREVIDRNLPAIRKAIGEYMKWYRENGPC